MVRFFPRVGSTGCEVRKCLEVSVVLVRGEESGPVTTLDWI